MAFYTPIYQITQSVPVFIFIDEWVEEIIKRDTDVVYKAHIEVIIHKAIQLMKAEYYVLFVRKDGDDVMSDVWAHDQVENRGSWPLLDVKIFRNYEIESSIWVWSGNTVRTLWDIESWRLQCKKHNDDFLWHIPVIDEELLLWEDFF